MNQRTFFIRYLRIMSVLLLVTSGCTLKASTESSTDTTTNFLSSTTPGAWYTEDGLLKPDQKINAFIVINYETLQQQMAQGRGEYLTALGTLLEVPDEKMPSFHALVQQKSQQLRAATEHNPQAIFTMLSDMQLSLKTY